MVILLHSQVTLKCVGRVEIVEGYTSDRKRDLVNFWLLKLPAHAWVVYPDVDEFFTYPSCIIDLVSAGFDDFVGSLVDRFNADFPQVRPWAPDRGETLQDVYPMVCPHMRQHVSGTWDRDPIKHVLFRAWNLGQSKVPRQFRSSHKFRVKGLALHVGPIAHYGLTGGEDGAIGLALKKLRIYDAAANATGDSKLSGRARLYRTFLSFFDLTEWPRHLRLSPRGAEIFRMDCKPMLAWGKYVERQATSACARVPKPL